jgi:heme/copper-type cytochrome/quinol oxidase subunit 3
VAHRDGVARRTVHRRPGVRVHRLLPEGLGYTTSLFSSSFYTLTGFHGVHVTVGIIMLVSLVGMLSKGKVTGTSSETVELVGLYWHFVDIVWILIFTLVYLIPA